MKKRSAYHFLSLFRVSFLGVSERQPDDATNRKPFLSGGRLFAREDWWEQVIRDEVVSKAT
jgi:hypothetical protein